MTDGVFFDFLRVTVNLFSFRLWVIWIFRLAKGGTMSLEMSWITVEGIFGQPAGKNK
jgi:hypothetical protein